MFWHALDQFNHFADFQVVCLIFDILHLTERTKTQFPLSPVLAVIIFIAMEPNTTGHTKKKLVPNC